MQVTTVTPWPTKNHDNPNVSEIVFQNDLDQIMNKASAEQLKDSPSFLAALELFQESFKVTNKFNIFRLVGILI